MSMDFDYFKTIAELSTLHHIYLATYFKTIGSLSTIPVPRLTIITDLRNYVGCPRNNVSIRSEAAEKILWLRKLLDNTYYKNLGLRAYSAY